MVINQEKKNYKTFKEILLSLENINNKGISFINKDNIISYSYKDLFEKALIKLNNLQAAGIKPGQELILLLNSNIDFIIIFWACLLGGIIPVPISLSNENEHYKKLLNIRSILKNPCLLINPNRLERLNEYLIKTNNYEILNKIKKEILTLDDFSNNEKSYKIFESKASDIAFIQFSSGSTGNPKGITLTHENLIANITAILNGMKTTENDSSLSWLPLTHDMGLIGFHLAPLFAGINQYIMSTSLFIRNPEIWIKNISEKKITIISSPNFGLKYTLKMLEKKELNNIDLSNVRLIFNGAEPISATLNNKFLDFFGKYKLKKNSMFPVYGLAEASLAVTFPNPEEEFIAISLDRNKFHNNIIQIAKDNYNNINFVNLGYPVENCKIRIKDENNKILDENKIGEIQIKGKNVTKGYYNNIAANEKAFSKDGWLNTGDLGFLNNGCLFITGRKKDIIFFNGQNYYSHDLERIIEEQIDLKNNSLVVTAFTNDEEQKEELLIFIKYRKEDLAEFVGLITEIKKVLNSSLGINADNVLPINKIPKTTSGKMQRFKLVEKYKKGDFDEIKIKLNSLLEEKRKNKLNILNISNDDKKIIINILLDNIYEILGFYIDDFNKNFDSFGIESIKVPILHQSLEKSFKKSFPISIFFDYPNIHKLSDYIYNYIYNNTSDKNIEYSNIKPNESHTGINKINYDDIAIIGMSCRFPGANNPDELWDNLINGIDPIEEIPAERWDHKQYYDPNNLTNGKTYTKYGGFIKNIDKFDSNFFEIMPVEAELIDPQQRLLLEVCVEALENASIDINKLDQSNTGLFIGISSHDYLENAIKEENNINSYSITGSMQSIASGRISYFLGLNGPSLSIDTACSSSLVAVNQAILNLKNNKCNLAIAGSVNLILSPKGYIGFSKLNALSPDGRCKTFDDSADGYGRSEGTGIIVLKRYQDALRNNDNILGIIKSCSVNHDGKSNGLTVPNGLAQEKVINEAILEAEIKIKDIDYIEAHGSGTKLGDPQEINSLSKVFKNRINKNKLLVGSIKSNIGHTESAAGIAGIIKVLLALKNDIIPGNINFKNPNKLIPWNDIPIKINSTNTRWKKTNSPRIAGISSFGLSGTNAHMIIQEPPEKKQQVNDKNNLNYLLTLSAKNKKSLFNIIDKYINYLSKTENKIKNICYSANISRSSYKKRLAVTGKTNNELIQKLNSIKNSKEIQNQYIKIDNTIKDKRIVFLFSDSSSLHAQTIKELYEYNFIFKTELDNCSQIFSKYLKKSILNLLLDKNEKSEFVKNNPIYSLLMTIAVEYSLFKFWESLGIKPTIVIGNGIGEYSAALCTGIFKLENAVQLLIHKYIDTNTDLIRKKQLNQINDIDFIKNIKLSKPNMPILFNKTVDNDEIYSINFWKKHNILSSQINNSIKILKENDYKIFLEIGLNNSFSKIINQSLKKNKIKSYSVFNEKINLNDNILQIILNLYLNGININFENLINQKYNKVILPNYPFNRETHWVSIETNEVSINEENNKIQPQDKKKIKKDKNEISNEVCKIINLITGLPINEIEEKTDFFNIGLDSLMFMDFRKRLKEIYQIEIPIEKFFSELTNVNKITDYLYTKLPEYYFKYDANQNNQLSNHKKSENISDNTKNNIEYANIRFMKFENDKITKDQNNFIKTFIKKYNLRTKSSKEYSQKYKHKLSDWIASINFRSSIKELIYPIVSKKSQGSKIWDADNNEYIDIAIGFGVNYFGNKPKFITEAIKKQINEGYELATQSDLSGEVASLIAELTGVERVAFSNTGTEAVMAALRVARTVTGKNLIVKFAGSYHGSFDGVLIANDGNNDIPLSRGTPQSYAEDIIVLPYGSPESLKRIKELKDKIAGVLIEPVQSRRPGFHPKDFLQKLNKLTKEIGAAFILDDVYMGFRIHPGGSQVYFNIKADIVTYGKIIGGGMPIGIVAGDAKYIDAIDGGYWNFNDKSSPNKDVTFFAGTFCRHPLALAASKAVLLKMKEKGPELHESVNKKTKYLAEKLNDFFKKEKVPIQMKYFGSLFRFESFGKYDLAFMPIEMDIFYYLLLYKGIYTWERRVNCLSTAHTYEDIEQIIEAVKESISELRKGGFSFKTSNDIIKEKSIITSNQVNNYPMTSVQRRLFALNKVSDFEGAYHLTGIWKVQGKLDINKVEDICNELIERHESLRTSFEINGNNFIQKIHNNVNFKIKFKKIKNQDIDQSINDFIRPFNLSQAPLMRVFIGKINNNSYLLILDFHHIIIDGYSLNLLSQEFMKLYIGIKLPSIEKQYKDYLKIEQDYFISDEYKKQEKYWINKLPKEISGIDLPLDYSRPKIQSVEGNLVKFTINKAKTKKLKNLAKSNSTTLFMVLLSIYNILLSKLSNKKNIVIGTPITTRHYDKFENTIGMFTNTILLRNDLSKNYSFKDFLLEVKKDCLESYANQNYPFEKLVEKLKSPRDLSHNPLFDIGFVFENGNDRVIELANLKFSNYEQNITKSMFDFMLEAIEQREQLNIRLYYSKKLFKEKSINRWKKHLEKIIDTVLTDDNVQLNDINIISNSEKDIILNKYNSNTSTATSYKSILEIFENQVLKSPDNIALLYNDKKLTYSEVNEQSNQLARLLRNKGVKPDNIVGIMTKRSIEMIIGIFGILKAGAAYLPIDPNYPEDRIKYMLEQTESCLLLTNINNKNNINFPCKIIDLNNKDNFKGAKDNLNIIHKPDNLAYVMFTSGSTGKPKGVMIEHKSMINILLKLQNLYPLNENDTYILKTTYTFDISVTEIFGWFINGGRLAILKAEAEKDPLEIIKSIEKYNVTHINFVPSMLNALINTIGNNEINILKKLKYVFSGGEAIQPELIKKFNNTIPNVIFDNVYGPTEAAIYAATYSLKKFKNGVNVPIGVPINNYKIYILNENMNLQPIGVTGELYIGGIGVARGYLNNEKLTNEKFINNPFNPGEKIYKTGDLARWMDDGNIEYLGRIDHQVKIRGYRIELGEIESVINNNELIKNNIVVLKESENRNKYLIAYCIIKNKNHQIDFKKIENNLRNEISKKLPDYMIPNYFIQLENFPLTANGKIKRKELPLPDITYLKNSNFEAPRNKKENILCSIWEEVLKIDKIGINDDFFTIGGDSIKAILISSRLHEHGYQADINQILKYPTIKELSKNLINEKTKYLNIPIVKNMEYYPITSSQLGLYSIQNFNNNILYNLPSVFRIKGKIDKDRIEKAFNKIIQKHDVFRTSFHIIDKEVVQKTTEQIDFKIEYEELNSKDERKLIQDFIKEFDLEKAPLLRVKLIKVKEKEFLLIIDMHHIISDESSLNILINDFVKVYSGEKLDELNFQFKDYIMWKKNNEKSDDYLKQKIFWTNRFKDKIPVLNLPTDYPRPSIQDFNGEKYCFNINNNITSKVKECCKKNNLTLFMFLLTCYKIVLSKYSGQNDIVVGTVISGRTHKDLEKIVGLFINTLAIRSNPDNNKNISAYFEEVKQILLASYNNQNYSYNDLVKDIIKDRDISHNPIFDAGFVLQSLNLDKIKLDNYEIYPEVIDNKTSKFDLYLESWESKNQLFFNLEYCTKLFKKDTIKRFAEHFKYTLENIVHQFDKKLQDFEIISKNEKNKILNDFNSTKLEYDETKTINELFENQAMKTPDKPALICNNKELTYKELNEKSNQLAHLLRKKKVKSENIIGIMINRTEEMIISILGILKSGAAYLPIDPAYPEKRIEYMLENSECNYLITNNNYINKLNFNGDTINLDEKNFLNESIENLKNINTPSNLAYVIYTSGSTGKPKGVMIEHKNIHNFILGIKNEINFSSDKSILALTTISFDIFVLEIIAPLLNGLKIVIADETEQFNPELLGKKILEYNIDILQITPSRIKFLIDNSFESSFLKNLSDILIGGEALSDSLLKDIKKLTNANIYNMYGPTETTVWSTIKNCTNENKVNIGRPISNTKIFIVDENQMLKPIGIPGELYIAGHGLARGYLKNPELTKSRFIKNKYESGKKLYKTGDIAKWLPDGNIEFLGRIDHQIKIRGYRVEIGEIESQIIKMNEIKEAVVIVKEDNNQNKYLNAFIIANMKIKASVIRKHLLNKLPDYMIPSQFIFLDKLPQTPNGKTDRKALSEISAINETIEIEKPRNKKEKILIEIWKEILNIEKLGINQNFFKIGGDSIKAIQIISRLQSQGYSISINNLFISPTIKELSQFVIKNTDNSYKNQIVEEEDGFYAEDIENDDLEELLKFNNIK